MTTMSRGSDSRWYEPPPPRNWKADPTSLQRIESAENLRKSLLDSAAKTSGALPYKKNFQAASKTMNRSFDYDKSRTMASLPSTPLTLRGSLSGSAKQASDSNRAIQPSFTRQLSGSVKDLSSTSTGVLNKLKTQENAEKILNTPPSRPRTTTLTRFRPLPAIKHSAGSTRSDPTNDNNNTDEGRHPPPLLRSRTFDVIETSLETLPVVDDESSDDSGSESGSESDSEKNSESDASDSGVVSAESNRNEVKERQERRETIFERGMISSAVPVQTVTVTIEGKLISEYASQTKMGAIRSRPSTMQYGRDATRRSSTSSSSDNSDDSEDESSNSEGSDSDEDDEVDSEAGDGSGEEEEEEEESFVVKPSLPDIFEDEEMTIVEGRIEEDIIVYVKMPDDTLMLASSPRVRTLRELLTIIKETQINGSCLVISRKGLSSHELDKTLEELGINDNTTLHLITE